MKQYIQVHFIEIILGVDAGTDAQTGRVWILLEGENARQSKGGAGFIRKG
jgi:hypothetical protein